MKNILSLQSHVSYGYVGNRAAVFPLQRLGYEVTAVNTVQFSNHTGYGAWEGDVFEQDHIARVLKGIEIRQPLKNYQAILTGYLGDVSLGALVHDLVTRAKIENPDLVYCCDPVMGDRGRGIFVRPGLPEFFRDQLILQADIVTPNQFELAYLTQTSPKTLADIRESCYQLHEKGIPLILVTSVEVDLPIDRISVVLSSAEGFWRIETPKLSLDIEPNGAGDLTAALFLGHYLKNCDPLNALKMTVNAVYSVFVATYKEGLRELQMIAAQDHLCSPFIQFQPQKVF